MNSENWEPGRHTLKDFLLSRLFFWGLLAGLLILLLWFHPKGETAGVVMLLLSGGLYLLQQGLILRETEVAVRRFARGHRPREGETCAVHGTAVALGPGGESGDEGMLAAHIQIYDRLRRLRASPKKVPVELRYESFILNPTGIDTGQEIVKLMGFPDLSKLEPANPTRETIERIKAVSVATDPKPITRKRLYKRIFKTVGDRASLHLCYEIDPTLGVVRVGDASALRNGGDGHMVARVCRSDDEVNVIGRRRGGALVPSPVFPRGLPVLSGSVEEVRQNQGETGKALLVVAAGLLAVAAVLVVWPWM